MSGETTKAIVLYQPYATLAAIGIKRWETRPSPPNGLMCPEGVRGLPGLAVEPGERIAIVAGQKPPTEGVKAGGWSMQKRAGEWVMAQPGTHGPTICPDCPNFHPLPFGAVVATVVVTEALPMVPSVDTCRMGFGPYARYENTHRVFVSDDQLWRTNDTEGTRPRRPFNIGDQLPHGDWRPGRWAWRLTDVEACDPIPCKGAQGVFRLPDDVAAELAGVTR